MKYIKSIYNYLMEYEGVHYKKPINEKNKMIELKLRGQDAKEKFKLLGNEVLCRLPGYYMDKCSNWINQTQNVPEYFWIELKKEGFENCPSSISLAIKKVKQEICFYAAVEIKDVFYT